MQPHKALLGLREALELTNAPASGPSLRVLLACGFTPLHLSTYLTAYLRQTNPERNVAVATGLYGDLAGTLLAHEQDLDGVFAVIEWFDLDPRLGLRQLGGWHPDRTEELVRSAVAKFALLERGLLRLAEHCQVVVSPPLLELPPLFHTRRDQMHTHGAELLAEVYAGVARLAGQGIRVLNPAGVSGQIRMDVRGYLGSGFPYTQESASALASLMVPLFQRPAPKKGLITDLDGVLWSGIVGDAGPANVSWNLDGKSQIHGVYQVLLQSLADSGVLVGVASKNDLANVTEVLQRADCLIAASSLFPVEANWDAKSKSVARILEAWNIGESDVVFVDDSPIELAEVGRRFPGMTTLLFPAGDVAGCWNLIGHLRDLFGKDTFTTEDRLRSASLRSARIQQESPTETDSDMDSFLSQAEGVLTIEPVRASDIRALELVNKTNQFNLNGRRWNEAEWKRMLNRVDSVTMAVSYQDKYGPLGKIAVLAGTRSASSLNVHTWAMSCRAFGRRVEFHTLHQLFDTHAIQQLHLDFEATNKNGPLQRFLSQIAGPDQRVTQREFSERSVPLCHTVKVIEQHDRVRQEAV